MEYPWWYNGTSGGVEHHDDYPNSYCDPNAFTTQNEYICCNYCGDNHYNDQCPHFPTMNFVEDDFSKVQPNLHDNSFNLSWNHEHSLSWDPNYSFPSYAPQFQLSPNHIDESTPIQEKKPTIEEMLERLLHNQNEHLLDLDNCVSRAKERLSSIESLNEKYAFFEASNDSCVEDVFSSAQLTMESDEVLPISGDTVWGDFEVELEEGENNSECPIEISSLESNPCLSEQETIVEIPAIYVQNLPCDVLTLTDESQMDFIGCSKYFGAIEDNFETTELKPTMCHIESCVLKSLSIEGSCNSCMNECPFLLKPCLLKRNEDKVVMIFDTYD